VLAYGGAKRQFGEYLMKRLLLSITAALLLVACSDTDPVAPTQQLQVTSPKLATAPIGPRSSIFTSQTPEATLDATPGWEIATRFHSSKTGKVVGFRFWRAAGETGTNTAKLWSDAGSLLTSASFSTAGTGWQTVMLPTPYRLGANVNYRVSVNTNSAQVKAFGALQYGPITSGPLTADVSYYGQPTGAMPMSGSVSIYFADVIFEEDVPLPNLVVQVINPVGTDFFGNPIVIIQICNNGAAAAAATTTRFWHWVAPNSGGGYWQTQVNFATPAIAAGACYTIQTVESSPYNSHNEYHVWADVNDVVYESNEADNHGITYWNRLDF
jgi:hypothetical protein